MGTLLPLQPAANIQKTYLLISVRTSPAAWWDLTSILSDMRCTLSTASLTAAIAALVSALSFKALLLAFSTASWMYISWWARCSIMAHSEHTGAWHDSQYSRCGSWCRSQKFVLKLELEGLLLACKLQLLIRGSLT